MNNKDISQNPQTNKEFEKKIDVILKKEKRKRRNLWIIIIILIILLFLLCFSMYMLGYKLGKIGYVETTAEPTDMVIQVTENNMDFDIIEDLDIFTNSKFNYEKIIAPASYGSYKFKIENVAGANVTYNVLMSEENNWDINLKYRLKLDNIYIIGNEETWVDIDDFNVYDIIVTDKSENTYTIEWYWQNSDNDTSIGEAGNAEYKLKVNVDATYYDGEV